MDDAREVSINVFIGVRMHVLEDSMKEQYS